MTDWPALIQRLNKQRKLGYITIGDCVGRSESWVSLVATAGAKRIQPSGEPAEALIELYRRHFPGEAVPRVSQEQVSRATEESSSKRGGKCVDFAPEREQ